MKIFTYLDLEMNQTKDAQKIIQVGACVGNIETGEILEDLSCFVDPKETLNPFIINLTGITQEQVDGALTLIQAYTYLKAMHERHGSFINPCTWGGGDSELLRTQLGEDLDQWCFGRRWIDVKTLFVNWRISQGQPIQGGLAKSMIKVGHKFSGTKHNARCDAINTFHMHRSMLSKFKA